MTRNETGSADSAASIPDAGGELGDDDFHESVAGRHRRIDVSQWSDIYVIGDVHGCREELTQLVALIDPDDDDLLLFVGDLVTKGPDNRGVLDLVRSLPNTLSVRGNNEDKLLRERKELDSLDDDDLAYIDSFPIAISWDASLVVHGGLDPRRPLADQDVQSLLTFRSIPPENGYDGPFWFEQYRGPPKVYFGHTVLDVPVDTGGAVGLDTGCVYGGSLTAYDCTRERFLSVPAASTYQDRPDRKFVEHDDPPTSGR